ncbi:hypothetical protein FEM33_15405 [Dyadobacter flavalbus]|uniref:Uncharacterized protein n=1 Tax=Dyadobacter flavalbus TaxID=2579942 RepID=A0A5M8QRH7_9BACT|nr:hypothetical protein [Dyadobacter flavalbus]KAA6438857.1 hypothetical protein FEM33_15405 [Dyadobacter flavalbus]
MTPKQIERLRLKIEKVKKTLAAEKRKFGGYDDSRGLRYLPTTYYVQLADYAGGLKYTKWFSKNFPDDVGIPDFLFEWTILLYKAGQIKQAGQKAFQTFCSNNYVIDKFLERPIVPIDMWEGTNLENESFLQYFQYNHQQPELKDFAEWLQSFLSTDDFTRAASQFVELRKALDKEDNIEKRSDLVKQISRLEKGDIFLA